MDYKRLIRIISIILIIAGIGVGVYYLWIWLNAKGGVSGIISGEVPTTEVVETTTNATTTAGTDIGTETTTQEPQVITQKLSVLINSPVFEYWLSSKDNSLYFANLNGQIIKINNDGSRSLVSSQTLSDLHSLLSSADGSMVLAEFNYPELPSLSVFSASSTSWKPLPAGTISAAFSPDSKTVAYTDQSALRTMDLATQKITEIQKMSQVGFKLNWLKPSEILFYEEPSIETINKYYSFNLTTKIFTNIIDGQFGVDIIWSKDAKQGIKLASINRIPKLELINEFGDTDVVFTFLTIPEKCLMESSKIYCGVPKNIRSGIVLPDDYYKKKDYFADDIFELNLPTGKITKLFDGGEASIDASDLKIKDGALLFINRYDNKVYSLNIQ
jgi:hypothetical protein